ncbi:hypothetical protein DRE_06716 [Drechslerella stenobrocha 248]|uniref:Uncharacterized protein n=1 Tax=Drechslerella stenobrocha 248 TaxID=1043628 RepID=W7HN55_9PEZI|nr:hypothetical protein DRE_06716 [Drechslerella stenobrocha 248]
MAGLITLPNEIIHEIVRQLIPELDGRTVFACETWRRSPHIRNLRSLTLTCKHLSAVTLPHLYGIVVLDGPTRMIRLLRTLVQNPKVRGFISTMLICCPLHVWDGIPDLFSPREIFLGRDPKLNIGTCWDTGTMDAYAAAIFQATGLDRPEYKGFTKLELETLNRGVYWRYIPKFLERLGYENTLVQGLAVALIALPTRMERLAMWRHYAGRDICHFGAAFDALLADESVRARVLPNIKRLDFRENPDGDEGHLAALFRIPSVQKLVGEGTKVEGPVSQSWRVKGRWGSG